MSLEIENRDRDRDKERYTEKYNDRKSRTQRYIEGAKKKQRIYRPIHDQTEMVSLELETERKGDKKRHKKSVYKH